MATGGEENVGYSLAKVETVTLEITDKYPGYISIVVCQDKIVVLDSIKVQLFRLHDGKLLTTIVRLESEPRDLCLMDAMTICVLHEDGLIKMVSINSTDMSRVFNTTRNLRLQGVMDDYHGVVRFKENLVVCGVKQGMMYWCVVSLHDGHVDVIHQICKGDGVWCSWCKVTTKDNMIYISCRAGDEFRDDTGVYGFDILNPSQCIYKYKHQRLQYPSSIVINEDGNIFVCNGFHDDCIHQLTASCQLVAIFTQEIPWRPKAMFWDNGRLYVTCFWSSDITVFTPVYQGSHKASEVLVSDGEKQPVSKETVIQIGQGNVNQGPSSVVTQIPPSGQVAVDSEDDKQVGSHEDSEVETSIEIEQGNVDKVLSSVKKKMPPSGPDPEYSSVMPPSGPDPEYSSVIPPSGPDPEYSSVMPPSGPDPEDSSVMPPSGPDPEDSSVMPPSGPDPEDSTVMPPSGPDPEDEKQEVLMIDERKSVIEEASTKTVKEILFQKRVEEKVDQAGIRMSTEELGSFLSFQREIGTTQYFSRGLQTSFDGQESLMATEMFLQKNRPDMMEKWLEYKHQGKLTPELIDVIYTKERHPELHSKKDKILKQMVQLNIIVKARSFSENGVKEEDFFLTPCMLHQESPREVISPKQDPRIVSTSVLCFVLKENVMQHQIFNELLAAFVRRWPVAKKIETSENLMFCNCAVYDLNLFHRLILHYRNHVVFARVTRMTSDKAETPDAKLCTRVRKFITLNLRNITSRLDPNLKYELCVQSQESQDVSEDSMFHFSPPFHMWFLDEEHDPDSPITREHMNHARLNVALVTVFGNVMREVLLANFDTQYKDIYQAILAKKGNLIPARGKHLLNPHQIQLVYPDHPKGQKTGTVDQFDLSLLYTLIRNVSTVPEPTTRWGNDPQDTPRDNSLGACVERIRSYRNLISGHSPDAKMKQQEFEDYWNKFDAVLLDIENALGKHVYCSELAKHRNQVISVYEA